MSIKSNHPLNSGHGHRPVSAIHCAPVCATLIEWLSLVLIIGTVVLFPERPAWGMGFEVRTNAGTISGYAQQAPLGAVLGQLAAKGDYTIHIDEQLFQTPATFDLPADLPAEQAIQRIVQPHSYALVFSKVPGRDALKIDEIKVYAKGVHSTTYVLVNGD